MLFKKTIFVVTAMLLIGAVSYAIASIEISNVQGRKAEVAQRSLNFDLLPIKGESLHITAGKKSAKEAQVSTCDGNWQGDVAAAITSWYTGLEYYAVYQDPVETGCSPTGTYPFEIQNVNWHVFNSTASPVEIDLQPVIFTVDDSDPLCLKPGEVCCYGPLYTVNVPVSGGGAIITLPMDSGCCVEGPYFAGVWAPDYIGSDFLGLVIDSAGFPSPFGSRSCATYNNYEGEWYDLVDYVFFPGNIILWSDGQSADSNNCDLCFPDIPAGVDLWMTNEDYAILKQFQSLPIPADFFNPGSDPFSGDINLGGSPLQTFPSGVLGPTDMIVLRNDDAELPSPGAVDVIQIEIIALSLVSTQPITVTYNGGMTPESWDVEVTLSSAALQPSGSMTITRDCCNGGTYSSTLPILPKLIFTRQGDNQTREYDFGAETVPAIPVITNNGYWSHQSSDPFEDIICPGMVALDHDGTPSSPDILIPPTSKFRPGFRTIPCESSSPDDPYCGGVVITKDSAAEFELLVKIPMDSLPPGTGACCPDGIDEPCMETTEDCCENLTTGFYYGDLISCQPAQCESTVVATDTICSDFIDNDCDGTLDAADTDCSSANLGITCSLPFDNETVIRRDADTPFVAGQIFNVEFLKMNLDGFVPDIGDLKIYISSNQPSSGQITVNSVDGSGNLTDGLLTADLYFDVEIVDSLDTLISTSPLAIEGTLADWPPSPGTIFSTPLIAPPAQLENASMSTAGYVCQVTYHVGLCTCCIGTRGDLNGDGNEANILDLTFIVNRIFRLGPPPGCPEEGDLNEDGNSTNILDLTFIVNRIFRLGPPPPPCP